MAVPLNIHMLCGRTRAVHEQRPPHVGKGTSRTNTTASAKPGLLTRNSLNAANAEASSFIFAAENEQSIIS
jgi:hypothetical protein